MNFSKQRNVRFVKISDKFDTDPFVISKTPLNGEFGSDFEEVVSRKKKIVEKTAVHFSFFILSEAKLHNLR